MVKRYIRILRHNNYIVNGIYIKIWLYYTICWFYPNKTINYNGKSTGDCIKRQLFLPFVLLIYLKTSKFYKISRKKDNESTQWLNDAGSRLAHCLQQQEYKTLPQEESSV